MPPVTPFLAALRILGGIGLVGGVAAFGYFNRALLVLPILALIFTISFGLGRWRAWRKAGREGTISKAAIGQAGTYVIQLLMVALIYMIGRGVGSISGVGGESAPLAAGDWTALACFGVFAIVLGLAIMVLERRALDHRPEVSTSGEADYAVKLEETPVNEDSFWNSHHYSNKDHVYDESKETVLNTARAYLNDGQISAEETRLGITLPPLLRRLYARQNGGSGMSLWVPCDAPFHNSQEGWINPFSGYDDMTPLNKVDTLYESISGYASDDEYEMFPEDSKRMIVLAQWYRETLFLDYRDGDIPRVGFADFDDHEDLSTRDWEAKSLWWDDFETFFSQLRAEVDR